MLGLTNLGLFHTAVSLVALVAGGVALIRDKVISSADLTGKIYLVTTAVTCITGFGIFQHGGFGPPHILGVITLITIAVALLAERRGLFGAASASVGIVAYSATYAFHWLPAILETTTRLPRGAPLFASQDAPALQAVPPILLLLLVIGSVLQLRRRGSRQKQPVAG